MKVGVFGSNGTLRIGGGNISANTLLHLYAPSSSGSGGIIDFVSNVTLNSSATAAVIAANTVTIENGVVVTIGASTSANVYTNVPNYSARSGGNNHTSGTFVGAVTTQLLGGQPPFDSPSTRVATRSTRTSAPVIHVTDSSQLSSLLDNATPGPNGKVRVSPVTRSRNAPVQGSTRTMAAELHRSVAAKARSGVLESRLQYNNDILGEASKCAHVGQSRDTLASAIVAKSGCCQLSRVFIRSRLHWNGRKRFADRNLWRNRG